MKNTFTYLLLLLFSLGVIGTPVIYFLLTEDAPDWNGLMGGIFSTCLALIGGIPTALWIDRIIKSQEQKNKEKANRKIEKEILDNIEEEIDWNEKKISSKRKIEDFDPLKIEYWEVLKSSGDLTFILDPKLLNQITSLYHLIKVVENLENQANLDWNEGNKALDLRSKWKTLWVKSEKSHESLLSSAKKVKKMITERRNKLPKG